MQKSEILLKRRRRRIFFKSTSLDDGHDNPPSSVGCYITNRPPKIKPTTTYDGYPSIKTDNQIASSSRDEKLHQTCRFKHHLAPTQRHHPGGWMQDPCIYRAGFLTLFPVFKVLGAGPFQDSDPLGQGSRRLQCRNADAKNPEDILEGSGHPRCPRWCGRATHPQQSTQSLFLYTDNLWLYELVS